MFKISAQDGEITIGGGSASTILFKSGTSAPDIRIFEASGSGSNYVTLTCAALASNTTLTLPNTTGTIALTSQITANTNLGTTDLTNSASARRYILSDNKLTFDNDGAAALAIDCGEGEIIIGGGGAEVVAFQSSTATPDIRIYEASGSGTNYVSLTLGALASNRTITFPDATGTLPLLESDQTFTGNQNIEKRKFITTGATDGDVDGDVVYFGSTSVNAGRLYYWDGSAWGNADADAASTSTGMLAISLGTGTASTVGMCIRGMVTISASTGGSNGDILYVHTTANKITSTAPSGSGDIVRIVGYLLDSTNDAIYFNPDGSFVEIA